MTHIAPATTSIRRTALVALLAAALGAAFAMPAAAVTRHAQATVDLRSPDARDSGPAAPPTGGYVDLRSPDARDSGHSTVGPTAPSPHGSADADWLFLAVGGAGLALAVALVTTTRRRRRRPAMAVRS